MLHLFQSNRIDVLLAALAHQLETSPLASPFEQEKIVVQSKGMGRWLNFRLAEKQGMTAQMGYPLLASFFWDLMQRTLGGQLPKRSPFSREIMGWRVLAWLDSQPNAPVLLNYLREGGDFRRFELATRIADVFDQYLVYRADWLLAWEKNQSLGLGDDEAWQAALWRYLSKDELDIRVDGGHRGALLAATHKRLLDPRPLDLPSRVSLFGISSLPPVYMEILRALSKRCEVFIHALNPCSIPWGEIRDQAEIARLSDGYDPDDLYLEVGNPLLAVWGKQGREFFNQLIAEPEMMEYFTAFPGNHETLLQTLKSDVLELVARSPDTAQRVALDDKSLQIHVCHSAMREVEVLHDQLLALFERDTSLSPADIVVLMPDIEHYIPYIEAVFGRTDQRKTATDQRKNPNPHVPFAIADRSLRDSAPLAQALLELLTLPQCRFTSDWMMALLDIPAIARRFDIPASELPTIHRWINELGIHWGRDGEHKAELGLPNTFEHTWRFGLDRLLLSIALPAGVAHHAAPLFAGTLPGNGVAGNQAQLAAGLAAFAETLFAQATALSGEHTPAEWHIKLIALIDMLFAPDDDEVVLMAELREQVMEFALQSQEAGYAAAVDLSVPRSWLNGALSGKIPSGGFLTGAVTFCAMVPMRCLPFRVIALLGFNDGAFPRESRPPGFDLMAHNPQYGDRSRRADDRYLFLETLLSASDVLYLSYVGRGIQDNGVIPPSVVVSDLIDAVSKSFVLADAAPMPALGNEALKWRRLERERLLSHLIIEHPLQPFSPRYFKDQRLAAYSPLWFAAATQLGQAQNAPLSVLSEALPPPELAPIAFADFLSFWRNPTRYLLRNRLGIRLATEAVEFEGNEPFSLSFSAKSELNSVIWQSLEQGWSTDAIATGRAAGLLPHGGFGDISAAKQSATMIKLYNTAEPLISDVPLAPYSFRFELSGHILTGALHQLRPNGQVMIWTDHSSPIELIACWLKHLALCLASPDGVALETRIVSPKGHWRFGAVENPSTELEKWLQYYWQGQAERLPFATRSSAKYAEALSQDDGSSEKAKKAAFESWHGNSLRGFSGEESEPWYEMAWRGQSLLNDEKFTEIAAELLLPMYQARGEF
ncbi:exodeoxyribonuclease V subunit gamma [Iodobacter sp.]|uniref:exodeoxyribonuclease V subunit gamma n=1 Tax=Iodobacter sp. TaxID=1915058 RepID=UPI0025DCF1D5|nr:exodeoxyribonuclease V subunit gamma [Iodobacter sp.]